MPVVTRASAITRPGPGEGGPARGPGRSWPADGAGGRTFRREVPAAGVRPPPAAGAVGQVQPAGRWPVHELLRCQYRQSTSRMPPGARTNRPAAVITAALRAGLVTGPRHRSRRRPRTEPPAARERMVRADPGPLRAARIARTRGGRQCAVRAVTGWLACRSPRDADREGRCHEGRRVDSPGLSVGLSVRAGHA